MNQKQKSKLITYLILLLLLLVFFFMSGCKEDVEILQEKQDHITYMRDNRTGLCFAVISDLRGETSYLGMANVPCDKVRRLLITKPEAGPREMK